MIVEPMATDELRTLSVMSSSFAAVLLQIQNCPQTPSKPVWHCGHAAFAKDFLELHFGEGQINSRVTGSFAKGIAEDKVIDDGKQSEFFSYGHTGPSERLQALFHVAHRVDAGGADNMEKSAQGCRKKTSRVLAAITVNASRQFAGRDGASTSAMSALSMTAIKSALVFT